MRAFYVLLLSVVMATFCPPAGIAGLHIGDPIPMSDVKMTNVDERAVSIGDVAGEKGTLVIFSCNHCPFVKAWQDRIVDLGNTCVRRGIGVILINSNDSTQFLTDNFAHMKDQAKEQGYKFPYVADKNSDVARAFHATRTPEAFLFDAKGALIYHGGVDDNAFNVDAVKERYLKDAVNALLDGHDVKIKETKSQGCTIKFMQKEETNQ